MLRRKNDASSFNCRDGRKKLDRDGWRESSENKSLVHYPERQTGKWRKEGKGARREARKGKKYLLGLLMLSCGLLLWAKLKI